MSVRADREETTADLEGCGSIRDAFRRVVAARPSAPAVRSDEGCITYEELDRFSDAIAGQLRGLPVENLGPVALLLGHDVGMVAAILGTLKSGRPYLPLDPRSPLDRLSEIGGDCEPPAILCEPGTASIARRIASPGVPIVIPSREGALREPDRCFPVDPGDLAAVLYTSGTSGRPRGVCVEQRALLQNVRNYTKGAGLLPGDRIALTAPFHVAASTSNLFGALLNGAELQLVDPREVGLLGLLGRLRDRRATVWHSVPTLFRSLVDVMDPGTCLGDLRVIRLGGEPVLRRDLEALRGRFADRCVLYVSYSSTETLSVCHERLTPDEKGLPDRLPVGRPVDGAEVSIVAPDGLAVAAGEVGEIVVSSRYLSPGYWDRARRSEAPSSTSSVVRRFRTGDLGKLLPDGRLQHLGRLDDRMKIRGHRVDADEVEAAVVDLGCARRAAVVVRADRGEPELVAYIVPNGGGLLAASEIRTRLLSRLPEPMIPARFVVRSSLPETRGGKLDRRALLASPDPAEEGERPVGVDMPRNALEDQLVSIWAEVLPGRSPGIRDNFFELGGHSLTAARVAARVERTIGVGIPPSAVLLNPTVSALAEEIRRRGADSVARPALRRLRDAQGPLPASFAQRRMWFLDRLEGGLLAYNMPYAFRVGGRLDPSALARAFEAVMARHEPLRTTFALEDGELVQVIRPVASFVLPVLDLRGLPDHERDREAERLTDQEADRPFDLGRDPMLRASILRLADDESILMVTLHHITSDGWSMRVLWRDLTSAYRSAISGEVPDWTELEVRYSDYSHWQSEHLSGRRLEDLLRYWRERLGDLPPLELLTDRPRRASPSGRGSRHPIALPDPLVGRLRRLGNEAGVTLYMTLLAGLRVLLSRRTGSRDIAVATPVASRSHPAIEPMIGFFANTLILRVDAPASCSFRELLERVRRVTFDAYDHQELPFDRLVEELRPERDFGRSPLVQVLFQVLSLPDAALALEGLDVRQISLTGRRVRFDLEFHLRTEGEGVSGTILYSEELFDAATIARLAQHYVNVLEAVTEDPDLPLDRVEYMSEPEARAIEGWGRGPHDYPREGTIHGRFAEQVARAPDTVAVVEAGRSFRYRELAERAAELAGRLRDRGVRGGDLVAVAMSRSPDMIASLLAILQCGCAYVPLDLSSPASWLARICDEAGLKVIVADRPHADLLAAEGRQLLLVDGAEAHDNAVRPDPAPELARGMQAMASAESPAYVIYTSGSTGRPKGVAVAHRSVLRLIVGNGFCRMGPDEVFLHLAPLAFDASTFEIWGPLLHGGRLVLAPDGPPDLADLECLIRSQGVSTLWLTARLFDRIVDERPALLGAVRQVLAGGESLSVSHVRRAIREMPAGAALINGYGPTECTTFACCHRIESDPGEDATSIPIGRPIAGTSAFVLDENRRPVPIGTAGELHLGGDGVAIGYLGLPDLTDDRFVDDGSGRGRLYRTGDLVRWLADGTLEFLGRMDNQVKLRGYRIEPSEIESALVSHPAVSAAAVLLRTGPSGEPALHAYWAPRAGATTSVADLREHLRSLLPPYMIPSYFLQVERFPLTSNGKVDRAALPLMKLETVPDPAWRPPSTADERRMIDLWTELLGLPRIGVDEDFFDLGGHSLLAVKLIDEIERRFGRRLPLSALFTARTIHNLTAALDVAGGRPSPVDLVPFRASGDLPPLFFLPSLAGDPLYGAVIAERLGHDQPAFGIQLAPAGAEGHRTLERMAEQCVEGLISSHPSSAYSLAGYSFGGMLAFETARQLVAAGKDVRFLGIVDTGPAPYSTGRSVDRPGRVMTILRNLPWWMWDDLLRSSPREAAQRLIRSWRRGRPGLRDEPANHLDVRQVTEAGRRQMEEGLRAVARYRPGPYSGRITLLRARAGPLRRPRAGDLGWSRYAGQAVDVRVIPGGHGNLLKVPQVDRLAMALRDALRHAGMDDSRTVTVADPSG